MILCSLQNISKSYSGRSLFEDLSLSIYEGDRIGLIGLNGCGKSTLLKIVAGVENGDTGLIAPRKGLKLGYVPQTTEFDERTPYEQVFDVIKDDPLLADYEKETIARLWLSKLGFTGTETRADLLSGGWKKRLAIAREMAKSPDLLLLDEPTNHLDLEGVLFLEKFLPREVNTYLLVSHDRLFLEHLTNRMVEVSPSFPKGLFMVEGAYSEFLQKKEEFLAGQIERQGSIASKLRREEEWLKRSPKARTTKSKSRIDAAEELSEEHQQIQARNQVKRARLEFTGSERETKKLITLKNISKSLGGKKLFEGLELILSPGLRLGLLGANGSGKTTLLKLLANELTPDEGTIKRADLLKVVYFDQHRTALPDNITLKEALSPNGDYVEFQGRSVHVNGWCKRFLFSPDRLDLPIGKLSGGERARIAIAHLMVKPADILLLDEPTNDLDIPTLELLEENLLEFPGAIVLISHDRFLMRRLCTSYLALTEGAHPRSFVDYSEWESRVVDKMELPRETTKKPAPTPKAKISFSEKRDYEALPEQISKAENDLKNKVVLLEDPIIAEDAPRLNEICKEIALLESHIEGLYLKWEALEKKMSQS